MTHNIHNFSAINTYKAHSLSLLNNNLKLHLEKLLSFSFLKIFTVYLTIFPQTFCRNFCAAKKSISPFSSPLHSYSLELQTIFLVANQLNVSFSCVSGNVDYVPFLFGVSKEGETRGQKSKRPRRQKTNPYTNCELLMLQLQLQLATHTARGDSIEKV